MENQKSAGDRENIIGKQEETGAILVGIWPATI